MKLYFSCLIFSLIFDVLSLILAPILPLFARNLPGKTNNNNSSGVEPRLPNWLSWFMTPDNSLWGDSGWQSRNPGYKGYLYQVGWLIRNHAYGFKWEVLSCPVDMDILFWDGNLDLTRNDGGVFGDLWVIMGDYWQYKIIKKIPFTTWAIMLNFGWLLDSYCKTKDLVKTQPKALFLFSPRIVKIKK